MRRIGSFAFVCAVMLVSGTVIHSLAQDNTTNLMPLPYNPYPPGILPPNLNSEIARVQREIRFIEGEAISEWQALPPANYQGNPSTIQGSGYQAVEVLGKLMNFDLNISPFKNQACASCHMPYAGFSGPIPSVNLTMIAYPGTFHYRAGKRTA